MHVTTTAVQELGSYHKRLSLVSREEGFPVDIHAKKPSSSSLRLGAGRGAPGPSLVVGSLTYPPLPKGFSDCSLDKMGVGAVLTGMSGSRRDQPMEFMESRKDVEAMASCCDLLDSAGSSLELNRASLQSKCTRES